MNKYQILGELVEFSTDTRRIHYGWQKHSTDDVINKFDRIVLPGDESLNELSTEERGVMAAGLLK